MKSKNKQKKNNEVPTIMDEHTSVMIEKEEEDDDVNNNGDDEEEDYDEDDVDENVNTSEDAMELFVKLYIKIGDNVRWPLFDRSDLRGWVTLTPAVIVPLIK